MPPTPENLPAPDWRHPELQGLLSVKARLNIELMIVDSLITDPAHEYDCGTEADYTTHRTDRVHAYVTAHRATLDLLERASAALAQHADPAHAELRCAIDNHLNEARARRLPAGDESND